MPNRTRTDFASEWAAAGAAVADHLPPRLARRLLVVVRRLPDREVIEARDAVALLEEVFCVPRRRELPDLLGLIESAASEARTLLASRSGKRRKS